MNAMSMRSNPLSWLTQDFEEVLGNGRETWVPALDIREDAERFTVEVETPGLKHDDIEVTFSNDQLVIKGGRKWEKAEGTTWHRRERGYGTFERTVTFPTAVDSGKIDASFKDGVLSIALPKAEETKPHKVQVKYLEKN
jgi:HSP20 family protein